jgi:putative tryptophan/tyrosine transport system substrate-binding protein
LRRVSEKLKTCDSVFAEALAQQNATSEILRASSRTVGKKIHSVALTFLFPVTALLCALSAEAQPPTKVSRIGYLNAGASYRSARTAALRQSLKELGYVEGKNIMVEYRYAEGKSERLPELARELLNLKVDIIFAQSTAAAQAAKNATATVPIVTTGADPVRVGLVGSLARPGENITGLTNFTSELAGKRLELLKETVPGLSRVAVFWSSGGLSSEFAKKDTEVAAQWQGVDLESAEVSTPNDIEPAFSLMRRRNVGAFVVLRSAVIVNQIHRVVDLAVKSRLPAMVDDRAFVRLGGLVSYGANLADLDRRAAAYIDKILKGAKPASLPIEQPTKFELVINLKTASALGLKIPAHLLMEADKVIE